MKDSLTIKVRPVEMNIPSDFKKKGIQ